MLTGLIICFRACVGHENILVLVNIFVGYDCISSFLGETAIDPSSPFE